MSRTTHYLIRLACLLASLTILTTIAGGQYTDLHDFPEPTSSGTIPNGATLDTYGNVYGTTYYGGANDYGMVWEVTNAGAFIDLHDFYTTQDNYAYEPYAGVTIDGNGNLYGTTEEGGEDLYGTAWEISKTGTFQILHNFYNASDNYAYYPNGSVTIDGNGNLYGTTQEGGGGDGTAWEITNSGQFLILHTFYTASDDYANYVYGGVSIDSNGNLYGTTYEGGEYGGGVVWEITSGGQFLIVHNFGSVSNDGAYSYYGVTVDSQNNLYGATYEGGYEKSGIVWEITNAGQYQILHYFFGTPSGGAYLYDDGNNPFGGVAVDGQGDVFGTTYYGGANAMGTAWEITSAGQYLILHNFDSISNDGTGPDGNVSIDSNGDLFGTTEYGGADGGGGMVWAIYVPPSLSMPANVPGGNSTTGTVTLSQAAPPNGTTVALSSGSPGVASVPSSIFVGAGLTSAIFTITTHAVAANTPVTITASVGRAQASESIIVKTAELESVTLLPSSILGGSLVAGTLNFNVPTPSVGTTVSLSSSNSAASVQATVVVAGGVTSAMFSIVTSSVGATTSGVISASLNSVTRTTALMVQPPTVGSVTLSPTSVLGGVSSMGTVTLSSAPVNDISVSLISNQSFASVPATVTVAAGSASAQFSVTTTGVATTDTATISATTSNTHSATLSVKAPTLVSITRVPSTVVSGGTATGTVTLSSAAAPGGTTVALSPTSGAAYTPGSVLVPGGSTSAQFTINTNGVTSDTPVTISASLNGITRSIAITVEPPVVTYVTLSPASVVGGSSSTGTVGIATPAPAGGLSVPISSSQSFARVPATVTILACQTSGTFTISSSAVAANGTATISASIANTKSATLTVTAPVITALRAPGTITTNEVDACTVVISSAAPSGGLTITLASTNSEATVPASITIPAGQTQATFNVTGLAVTSPTTGNIVATLNGAPKSAPITVKQ